MEGMSPNQDNVGQGRACSLTGEPQIPGDPENNKKMKSLAQRRQSAPSLVLSKALKSRTINKESSFTLVSPETCPLVQAFSGSTRAFIAHSHVQLKTGLQTQDRHLFLFTDVMIIAKSKSPSNYKLKQHVRVGEMWTASCMEEVCEGSTYPERSFVIGWPVSNCVATFSTPEEKEKWFTLLQRHIKEEKANDHPKTIPLKIITKDLGNCAYSKILTITNEDTANDVIRMALLQFGVEGSDTDYRLWVTSGKDDSPYPLIGHEYPFGIKMSHVRDALPQIEGLKDTDCPLDLHGPFLMEHLPHEMQCQFILKPSRLPPCHQLADSVQKPFKRKRSIINWTFWRSSSQLDNLPSSPTSSTPGMLFGLSLSAIAENGNLPKPVMDMLSVLCREGPFTRGIFRRSANAKSCKEMKEKLNSGYEVNYELESVFVIASVFKDFLRNVPGSVFSSKLYDKWISILGQGSEGEKIQGIKKLIETLPQINIILLRYLFGVLHCIEQRSDTNQMSAFNLAVCIAPSLLWPLNPSGPAVEGELTRKVSDFVQFLIENCCVVFDEDISLLYAKHDPRENSDICLFKHNDSSYDSLENELNDEADSPFSDFPKKHSPDNRSRDSVLTLSDCDLDHPDGEDAQNENPLESQSLRMATILQHSSFIHKQSKKESLSSNTSGYPSATFSKALKYARRPRRSSEPAIAILVSRFSKLNECPCENAVLNTSCDELNHTADNYLKQHRDLQVEGQKLINRSLTLGIGVSKSINKKTAEKRSTPKRLLVPPALTLGPQTCSSSLSSPGTSPSGSSLSSLDSAFSQFSDYSVLTSTNELPSPLESNFRSHKKPLELTPDNVSSSFFSGVIVDEDPKQPFGDRSSENDIKGTCHKIPPRIHPNAWLKCGNSAIKNWSLRKKQKLKSLEEKNKNCRNLNPEEPQSESCNISECSVLGEQTTVPKAENLHLPTLQKNENVADSKPSSSSLYEVSCEGKNTSRHLLRDKVMIDNNDTGDYEKEHSSFHSPSALPAYSKEKTIIPHTLFFGQECALYSQTNKRKMNNSLSVEQSVVLDTNVKGSGDSETRRLADEDTSACKTLTANFRVASLKRNKVLPSNIDTGFKMANCDLEKNFCVSPKPVTTTESFFFQPDSEKHIKNCHNINFTTSQNNSEWQNKFEDIDQRFHPEESYV